MQSPILPSDLEGLRDDVLTYYLLCRVRLFTTIPTYSQLEGVIDFIDPKQHLLAFVARGSQPTHHLIALSALKDFELLPNNAFPLPPLPPPGMPPPINTKAVMARANEALAKAKEKAAKRNPSVSKEAQEIFDAIGRQFSTRWEGKDIVVMDHVMVKGPGYRAEDCKAGKDAPQGTLARVKKVVSHGFFLHYMGSRKVPKLMCVIFSLRMSASASAKESQEEQ